MLGSDLPVRGVILAGTNAAAVRHDGNTIVDRARSVPRENVLSHR
jgi:hypothetical protein